MRHGKKGNMKLFLEDAPPEMNFIQDSVQLTTKVKYYTNFNYVLH